MTLTHTGDRVLELSLVTDALPVTDVFGVKYMCVATNHSQPITRCQEEARVTANASVLTTLFAEHHSG
jgi:hypothetical protein